jgi:4-amino-4-deoxy-L-arabinose transferase-like glycosyltransferase
MAVEMNDRDGRRYMRMAWLLIGLCTIGRIFYSQLLLLAPDEANYWQWARHLAWGYHDQTPLIAWAIHVTTGLFGHTELGVRLPSIVAMLVASAYAVLIARRWFSPRIAWHSAVLIQSVLAFNVGGLLATADGLQGAAWVATSYHTARGFEENKWRHWLLGGVCFGLGLLSKYSMIIILASIFFYALFSPKHRRRLISIKPYAGLAVGLLFFVPVIIWNAANNWNSFRHVAHLGGANESFSLHIDFLAEYIASQAGLLTPMVFVLICGSWWWVMRRRSSEDHWIHLFLFFTSFPIVICFAVLSLHTRVYANWPCAGYITAAVLTTGLWLTSSSDSRGGRKDRVRPLWRWTVASSYVLTAAVLIHTVWPILPIPADIDRSAYEIKGWDKLGQTVADVQRTMPASSDTFIFGLSYQIASQMAFYMPGQPQTVSINRWTRPNVYDYWWQDRDLIGKDAIGILERPNKQKRLLKAFERVDPPIPSDLYAERGDPQAEGRSSPLKTFYLYRCYGFKGGLRWKPRHAGDIRAVQ